MTALEIAKAYFDYSNQSNMVEIADLFSEHATYYSTQLGFFVGKSAIMDMQREFHGRYQSVRWTIEKIEEIKLNVVQIAFSFHGVLCDGQQQKRQSSEHILISDHLIQHIAVGL